MGIVVARYNRLYEGKGPLQEEFVRAVQDDLLRRGYSFIPGPERGSLVYEDFWNKATIRTMPEGPNLRYLFTIEMTTGVLILIIAGVLLLLIVAIIVSIIWYMKHSSLKSAMIAAGESAAIGAPPPPPPPPP